MPDRAARLPLPFAPQAPIVLVVRWDREPPTVRIAGRGWCIPDQPIPAPLRTSPRALRAWAEAQPRPVANDAR